MQRIVKVLLLLFIASCINQQPKAPLTGLLWGGEGNRLIIQSVSRQTDVTDTIIINHLGEFTWQPDSLFDGLYKLSKTDGSGTVLVLDNEHPTVIDGQYFTFPNLSEIEGVISSDGFIEIDQLSSEWREQIKKATTKVVQPNWQPQKDQVSKLHAQLDSIDAVYKPLIFQKRKHPLEEMYALIQSAGHRQLFNIINDSSLFISTAKKLKPYKKYPSVNEFLLKTDELQAFIQLKVKLLPGNEFPFYLLSDTTKLAQLKEAPVYLEIYSSTQTEPSIQTNTLLQYANSSLKIFKINLDSISKQPQPKFVIEYQLTNEEKELFLQNIPIHQLPTNFIIDKDGIIVAQDIWNQQQQEVLDKLLKK